MKWLIDIIKNAVLADFQHIIMMWFKPIAEIPNGWGLCDGTQGLPDLREKFIKGTAAGVDPGGTGGAVEHVHDIIGGYHAHGILAGEEIAAGEDFDNVTHEVGIIMVSEPADGQPPYYEMVFIGKL